jgi:hypothetical protein
MFPVHLSEHCIGDRTRTVEESHAIANLQAEHIGAVVGFLGAEGRLRGIPLVRREIEAMNGHAERMRGEL